jgi:hypothetical protein
MNLFMKELFYEKVEGEVNGRAKIVEGGPSGVRYKRLLKEFLQKIGRIDLTKLGAGYSYMNQFMNTTRGMRQSKARSNQN